MDIKPLRYDFGEFVYKLWMCIYKSFRYTAKEVTPWYCCRCQEWHSPRVKKYERHGYNVCSLHFSNNEDE